MDERQDLEIALSLYDGEWPNTSWVFFTRTNDVLDREAWKRAMTLFIGYLSRAEDDDTETAVVWHMQARWGKIPGECRDWSVLVGDHWRLDAPRRLTKIVRDLRATIRSSQEIDDMRALSDERLRVLRGE